MSPLTFIFIGRSGCGKGTQAKLLIEELKKRFSNQEVFYLATGQTFRDFEKSDSYTAKLSKEVYETGDLQPEFLAIWAWSHLMVENLKGGEHLVIDGMPRKLNEAYIFETALSFYKRQMPIVVYVNVSNEWAMKRLTERGRSDDNADDIKVRLAWFESVVVSVLDFFKNNPKYRFVEINGEQPVEKVTKDILEKVFK